MSHETSSSLRELKRAIAMCKWAAPSPSSAPRGTHGNSSHLRISPMPCVTLTPLRLLAAIKGRTSIELLKKDISSLGLTISGGIDKDGKPRVAQLKPGSVAQKADVLEIGDILLGVNGIKTAGLKHEQVIDIIKQVGDQLTLDIEYDLPKWRMWNKFFLVFSFISSASSSFAYNYA